MEQTARKKKKPRFNVPNLGFFGSVKPRWRKPRGTHNKKRMKAKWAGASPRVGYRNQPAARGLHPSGHREALVANPAELEALKGQKVVVRIASAVGKKKRKAMAEIAKAMKLVIVNMKTNGKAGPAEKSPEAKAAGRT
ncbi:MAG: eL32 family ribosomal protein [Candidatus Micrarchaeota archaeon]